MTTILLLILSNIFMTLAWYGHLKFPHLPMLTAILIGWGIALVEYCFAVPANRIGYAHGFSGGQLKVIQEVITLTVFAPKQNPLKKSWWIWLMSTSPSFCSQHND